MPKTSIIPPSAAAILGWRQRLGLDQRSAAAALGLSLPAYQEIERGTSFATGRPRAAKRSVLLACAAIEANISPLPVD